MKKLWLIVGLVGALWATTAQATFQISSWDRLSGYYSGNGGEFTLTPNTALAAQLVVGTFSDISSMHGTFESFCLETGESMGPKNVAVNVVINNKAIDGGVGPQGDPLSIGTSWLYSQFRNGGLGTLSTPYTRYNYSDTTGGGRSTSAGLLQDAIWFLEDEAGVPDQSSNPFILAAEHYLGNGTVDATLAQIKADAAPGAYGVVALNLYDATTGALLQDQLALVPEPTTMIAGALLLLPFGASTLRILRKNRAA